MSKNAGAIMVRRLACKHGMFGGKLKARHSAINGP